MIGENAHLSETKRHLLDDLLKSPGDVKLTPRARIRPRPTDAVIPLSFPQQQVWAHAQMLGEIPAYNEAITIYCAFHLDLGLLERCMVELLQRHEIWRTAFRMVDGNPIQIVQPAPDRFHLSFKDLRHLAPSDRESEAARLATEDARRPFDLETSPLLRVLVGQTDDAQFRIYLTFHQIVFDAFTAYRILVPEISSLYTALSEGHPFPPEPSSLQYGDFACWQHRRDADEAWAAQLSFWRSRLSGGLPTLQWPSDRQRTVNGSYSGATQRFSFKPELIPALEDFCRTESASSYMVLVASFAAMLSRFTAQEDILIGGFSAGRKQPELESVAGYFVNPFALRIDASGNPSFRELVGRAKRTILDTLANQEIPFPKIVKDLRLHSDRGRNPIFQIALSQQPLMPPLAPGWNLATEEVSNGGCKMDMIVVVDERPDSISGPITYNSELFSSSAITNIVEHWQTLLSGALTDPKCGLSDLPLLTTPEIAVLSEWNDTRSDDRRDLCVQEMIETQVKDTPDAVALTFESQNITYRELNARANQLAHYLRTLGVGPDVLVGLCVERSAYMVTALLGILKAGGAYVPLDPNYPKARLAFMAEDSRIKVLVTEKSLEQLWSDISIPIVFLDQDWPAISRQSAENPQPLASPENLLYVIYTSGSTGTPKGVQVCHRGFVNLTNSVKLSPCIRENDTWLALTTISFDIAAAEVFMPLTVGARVIVASRRMATDPNEIARCIEEERVTTLQATPVTWKMLIESGWQGNKALKIICTGEVLTRTLADQLLVRAASVWNMYGPTETTIWSTGTQVTRGRDTVSIGRPLANTQTYVLDKCLRQLPIGAVGELYIGGEGVARGYLNRPELTAERFLPDPVRPGSRIYKTGDLARFREDGEIECLGRGDRQVKIRGYRIELDEIESVLHRHESVRDAAVIVREDTPANPVLIAYVVSSEEEPPLRSIRDFLKQNLPGYMVPDLVSIGRLPLTPNGKLDRKALPVPQIERNEDADFAEPSTEMEKLLAQFWKEALQVDRISIYDNFFDLGGNSLSAIRVLARLEKKTGVRIKPSEAAFQTLGQLAAVCRERTVV